VGLSVGVICVALVSGCRIARSEARWVEAHGAAEMSQIAASPRGVDGYGSASVRHYPGGYADPWTLAWTGQAISLAATLEATYTLTTTGDVVRTQNGSSNVWRATGGRRLSSIHGGLTNELFGISQGVPLRLSEYGEHALACRGPALQITALDTDAYVLNQDGSVEVDRSGRCERVSLPSKASAIAVNHGSFYFLAGDAAYERQGDAVTKLPNPIVYRGNRRDVTHLASLSASENILWARSTEGFVFQLVQP
jgi:hypothetical protein